MTKLSDIAKISSKGDLYNKYFRLVYAAKSYANVTKQKMLQEIVKEYSNPFHPLYSLCTERELKFLDLLYNHPDNLVDKSKYYWEITQLADKLIIDRLTLEIYDEQRDSVGLALAEFTKRPHKGEDDAAAFIVGLLRAYSELPEETVVSMTSNVSGIEPQRIRMLIGANPLLHFYAGLYEVDMEESTLDGRLMMFYHEYDDGLRDEILDTRKRLKVAPGAKGFYGLDYIEMFYYGMPLRLKSNKKFYEAVSKLDWSEQAEIFSTFDDARILFDENILHDCLHLTSMSDELKKLMKTAWNNAPSPALCGLTPKEWRKDEKKREKIENQFVIKTQTRAHLSETEADEYYELYFALLEYTNKTKHIKPNIKKIFRQKFLDIEVLQPIDAYLWSHKKIINRFIAENPYDFTTDMLETIKGFKSAITREMFVVVGFEEEYTKFFSSKDKKIYMVKGIRGNFDELLPREYIPLVVGTTLLNFKDKIIFNSFCHSYNADFGTDWKQEVLEGCSQAEICYKV